MKVYLDNNATAPIRPEVIDVMSKTMREVGNASSIHNFGRMARRSIESARTQIGALAGVEAEQVIFTSGATEANNMILNSYAGSNIMISAIEHPSVMMAAPDAHIIPVSKDGVLDMKIYEKMLDQHAPGLVSVMMVNNETGVIQPVKDIADMAREYGADTHSDAVQAAGRIKIDFSALGIDYMSLSAHKFGGPHGIGALIYRKGKLPKAFLKGGGQERRVRAGTENIAGIAGFAEAARLARENMEAFQKLGALRDKLENGIQEISPAATIYSQNAKRVANTSCFGLPGIPAETLLMNLDLGGIAVSSGSACSSGVVKSSPVIRAMGASDKQAASTIRISLSWQSTQEDIDHFLKIWSNIVERLKDKIHPVNQEQNA